MEPYIIATTGTKGKTTVTRLLAQIMHASGFDTLRVDTQQVAVDEQVSKVHTRHSSKLLNGLGLAVVPGRFLHLLAGKKKPMAVLETSIGCGNSGTGYRHHNVGVFLNVYGDHISEKRGIKNRADIAEHKSFIFSKIAPGGWAVFNADDKLVCKQLKKCPAAVNLLPFGHDFKHFNLKKHLKGGGVAVSVQDGQVVLLSSSGTSAIIDVAKLTWSFDGHYPPSVSNALAVCGALVAQAGGSVPSDQVLSKLKDSSLNADGGRLQLLRTSSGVKILADFAHEEVSLGQLFDLAHRLSDGKVLAVVRLSPRGPELIAKVAKAIAKGADETFVYNKYDGILHKVKPENVERSLVTTKLLAQYIQDAGTKATLVKREDDAAKQALKTAKPGDIVVHMVHDDHAGSMRLLRSLAK